MMDKAFVRDVVVNWSDADPAAILWFGTVCRYVEETEEEMFRSLGRDRQGVMTDLKILMPRTHFEIRFRSPAKVSDRLRIGMTVGWPTARRIEYAFTIEQRDTGALVSEGHYRIACVTASTFEARAFPEELVALLVPFTPRSGTSPAASSI